jgi:hypothetical protein
MENEKQKITRTISYFDLESQFLKKNKLTIDEINKDLNLKKQLDDFIREKITEFSRSLNS